MVEKVKACYVFQVDGDGLKYYIDLKEGEGQVGEGDVPNKPADFKPEVKITMSQENMLKMFNRKYSALYDLKRFLPDLHSRPQNTFMYHFNLR